MVYYHRVLGVGDWSELRYHKPKGTPKGKCIASTRNSTDKEWGSPALTDEKGLIAALLSEGYTEGRA
jgi:hypothetical protein